MSLPLQQGHLVDCIQAAGRSPFVVDDLLVGMDVIGKIPISIGVLRCEAAGVYRGVDGPRMDLRQRIVLVVKRDPVAIFLENLREERLMHARAEGTLEIVEIYHYNLGPFGPARRPSSHVDLAHKVRIRVFAQVEFRHAEHRVAILRNEKGIVFLLAFPLVEFYRDAVITWDVARGSNCSHSDLDLGRETVKRAYLVLDLACQIRRRRLCHTAQTNQKQNEKGTSKKSQ